ncbi:MAG: glycosyltransferase family 4 protein [Deltaproteobacteria bacterium]|nr:glycosyltransferase family 4 protein [Deltaproteobacteria bacterium]
MRLFQQPARTMLTILHTESSLGWGGQENRTLYECMGLKRLGARSLVLCKPASKLRARAIEAGIEVFCHDMRSNRDISALRRIMRIVKAESVDCICTHSGDDSLLGAIAGRLSSRRPAIVRTRHLALPITSKITYSRLPHRVVTVSEFVRDYLVNEKGIDTSRVVCIPTGVDLKRFDPDSTKETLRSELGLAKDAVIVGVVAILRRKKGHHVLLQAIPAITAAVPEAVFVFAGNGPQKDNIEEQIRELGIGRHVRLLGLRPDVPAVLKGLDLFVLPTLQEALGTSILEASAMQKPVVASAVGGVPEVVKEGITGSLVPPEDPAALADAIIRLLRDRTRLHLMGQAGRKMVEESYTTERMAERMFALYNELAARRRG